MTEPLDLDRRVTDWLRESAPARAPERTLAGALERVTDLDQDRHLTQHILGDRLGRSARLRWGLALALVATAALAGAIVAAGWRPPSPLPTGPVSNGWVAYMAGGDIYVVGDGAPGQRVIGRDGDGVEQFCPVFSPDGSSLAHLEVVEFRPEGGHSNIVLTGKAAAGVPGGKAVRFPAEPLPDCPVWAPNGRRLAVLQANELRVIDLDGTSTVRFHLDDGGDAAVAWSPDGSTLALVQGHLPGTSEVWLVPADAGEPRLLYAGARDAENFSSIAWAPDGSLVAVRGHDEPQAPDGATPAPRTQFLRLIPIAPGANATELDPWTESADGASSSDPVWSPDGSRLAYVRNGQIVIAAADGTGARELPPVKLQPDPADDPINWDEVDGTWWPGSLSWSPDGQRVLSLGSDVPFLERGVRSSLVSVDAAGSGPPIVLTPWRLAYYGTREPAWQPVVPSVPAWDTDAAGVNDPSPLERTGPPLPTPTPTPPPQPAPEQP